VFTTKKTIQRLMFLKEPMIANGMAHFLYFYLL